MAETQETAAPGEAPQKAPEKDERVREMSPLRKALIRPELGAICGTILVFIFFLSIASDSGMAATGPATKLLFDAGHCYFGSKGQDPALVLQKYIDRVNHFHDMTI